MLDVVLQVRRSGGHVEHGLLMTVYLSEEKRGVCARRGGTAGALL